MIKINLLKQLNSGQAAMGETRIEGISFGEVEPVDQKKTAIKILIILIIPTLLYVYGSYSYDSSLKKLAAVQNELAAIEKEIADMGPVVDKVKEFQIKKELLETQIRLIGQLSRNRLDQVIALHTIQGIIPQKTWIDQLKMDANKLLLSGIALSEPDVSDLAKGLQESVFFTDVKITKSSEKRTKQGIIKTFEISCNVESI